MFRSDLNPPFLMAPERFYRFGVNIHGSFSSFARLCVVKRRFFIAIACILLVGMFGLRGQGFSAEKKPPVRTAALLPFGNLTVEDISIDVTRLVTEELRRHNLDVVAQEALEDFLVKRRIRRADFLDRPTIRAMGTAMNVDVLVMGNVSILSGGENPHVSINAQMVDCENGSVMWANSVSRTGADYAGFLGLGRITSVEKLVNVVVQELFEGLSLKAGLDNSSPATFEIVQADFFPNALRSGETAQLSMEVKEIKGKARDIRAFVMDAEIRLQSRDGKLYGGTTVAPPIEGSYPLKVFITDRWNRLFSMEAVAVLTVHNTPPRITLSPRQSFISPNRDGVSESVLFVPDVLEALALQSWKVEIADEEGQVVRSEKGFGALPQGFLWRGVDNKENPVKDGLYFCRLIAKDEAGNTTTALSEKVVVDATAPEVAVHVQEEHVEGLILALGVNDKSGIDYWDLVIYNGNGQELERFEGKGQPPETVTAAKKKRA
jgi:TolB-like protein